MGLSQEGDKLLLHFQGHKREVQPVGGGGGGGSGGGTKGSNRSAYFAGASFRPRVANFAVTAMVDGRAQKSLAGT